MSSCSSSVSATFSFLLTPSYKCASGSLCWLASSLGFTLRECSSPSASSLLSPDLILSNSLSLSLLAIAYYFLDNDSLPFLFYKTYRMRFKNMS